MKAAFPIAALAALVALPHLLGAYYMTLVLPAVAYAIALLGYNLLFGYSGLLSFGHALFVAIGAYGAAVLSTRLGIRSFEMMLLVSGAVAVAVSIPVGLLAVRYVKIFFGILTLAFGMLFHSFLFKFYHLTGGDTGIHVSRPTLFGKDFADLGQIAFLVGPFYYYCVALLAILGFLMWRLVNSPFGLHLVATRENRRKSEYLGVRVRFFRLIAFAISAFYCSVGGVILAINTGQADPELAYWTHSGDLVFMTVLGGFASFLGPVIGAFTFVLLKAQLTGMTDYWRFWLGVILLLIVVLFPRGIAGLGQDLWARVKKA
ncbi:MAG TPA: branched-chain amino acid ABC transporter permease [Usitatibacter sp.]|jgi:branched-chain amino acid transport system permease protein